MNAQIAHHDKSRATYTRKKTKAKPASDINLHIIDAADIHPKAVSELEPRQANHSSTGKKHLHCGGTRPLEPPRTDRKVGLTVSVVVTGPINPGSIAIGRFPRASPSAGTPFFSNRSHDSSSLLIRSGELIAPHSRACKTSSFPYPWRVHVFSGTGAVR